MEARNISAGDEESSLGRRIDEVERRIAFRLDVHQAALDNARESVPTRSIGARFRSRLPGSERAAVRPPAPGVGSTTHATTDDLVVATSSEPLVSIVIPVHGAIDDVVACLRSIARFPLRHPFEVIVANDASDADEFAPIRRVSGLIIVDNEYNQGFLATCNRASTFAKGDLLWLLNSDTELTPDAGDALVQTFVDFPEAGAAGSKLVYEDGTLQEAGGIVWRDASAWNYGRGGDPRDSEYDYARQADYVSAASLMVRRDVWEELGGFDPVFTPAYYEDTDLCMQIAESGRQVIYQPGSVVVHHEGKSYGTDVREEGKSHQLVNHETFLRKWGSQLASRRPNGREPELERERRVRNRVLVIDARMLTPDQDSGSLRMMNLLVALTHEGCRCTFLPHNMATDEPYAQALRVRGIEVIGAPRHRSVEAFLRRRGREFDVVMMSRLEVAEEHLTTVRQRCPRATVVYDTVDLHFLRMTRAALVGSDGTTMREAETTRDAEIAAIERSDVTLVCSTTERALVSELVPGADVRVVGNVHPPGEVECSVEGRSGLLFVGGFEHPPNVDGLRWFVADVLPSIVATRADVVLHVVGSRMIPEIQALDGPNVKVHGYVADLDPLYRSCRVNIAPLRFGAGVKGKVTQAMAVGLPTVGTSVAIEGAPFEAEMHVLVGDTAGAFAAQVERLLDDDDLWQKVSSAGLDTVREHFGPHAAVATLADILELERWSQAR